MPSDLTMREATLDDLPAIIALSVEDQMDAVPDDAALPLDPAYAAAFAAIAASPDQLLAVGEINGAVIGTLQLTFLPGLAQRGALRGQIEAVRVSSSLRGQKIGAQMIAWALDRCRERGCLQAQLTSNNKREAAHRFYERLGWAQSHAGFKYKL